MSKLDELLRLPIEEAAEGFLKLYKNRDASADVNQDGILSTADWSSFLAELQAAQATPDWPVVNEAGAMKFYITGNPGDDDEYIDFETRKVGTFAKAWQIARDRCGDGEHRTVVFAFENVYLHNMPRSVDAIPDCHMYLRPHKPSDPRPRFVTPGSDNGVNFVTDKEHFGCSVTLYDLQMGQDGNTYSGTGARFIGPWLSVDLTGCDCSRFDTPILVQGEPGDRKIESSTLWRNVCEIGTTRSHAQGIKVANVGSVVMHENIVINPFYAPHSNGRVEHPGDIFGHDAYIQSSVGRLKAYGNIFFDAQSHGLQARCGGLLEYNLAVGCPIGFLVGNHTDGEQAVDSQLNRNFAIGCGDIRDESIDPEGRYKRGTGFYFEGVEATARQCAAIAPTTSRSEPRAFEVIEDRPCVLVMEECGASLIGYKTLVRIAGNGDYRVSIEAVPAWSVDRVVDKTDGSHSISSSMKGNSGIINFDFGSQEWRDKLRKASPRNWPTELMPAHVIGTYLVPPLYPNA